MLPVAQPRGPEGGRQLAGRLVRRPGEHLTARLRGSVVLARHWARLSESSGKASCGDGSFTRSPKGRPVQAEGCGAKAFGASVPAMAGQIEE